MQSINVSELINAGVHFTIEDEKTQRHFDSDGELLGVRFELGEYVVFEGEMDDDPLCDINELRDSDDRWGHVGDAHVRELELQRSLYRHLDTDRRDWREYGHLAQWRYDRFVALSRYAERCTSRETLRYMRKGIWKRYVDSVKGCAVNGTWWALYLTKDQADSLMDYISQRLG
jgi:hypothetical protein